MHCQSCHCTSEAGNGNLNKLSFKIKNLGICSTIHEASNSLIKLIYVLNLILIKFIYICVVNSDSFTHTFI